MNDYWKLKKLTDALMDALSERMTKNGFKRLLADNGFNAASLEALGFSESHLYGLGLSVEEVAAG